ncbi:hypothetical protein RISK_002830 [Rhodopirellula islandica]|uniref:Transmembrane protein n=1 Tax=Rhodopirellula islandica TaxID=595434 RepID=A0A0J1BER2_RHOIS|nr:hypothetical protein [Rhodopirellula islandica]KLU05068.1 hypothetical protein RISK_002830 [Rhodopirellula islandica]
MREPPNPYQTTFVCEEQTRAVSGIGKNLLGDTALVLGVTASGIGLFAFLPLIAGLQRGSSALFSAVVLPTLCFAFGISFFVAARFAYRSEPSAARIVFGIPFIVLGCLLVLIAL